ncbi:aldehyde dehydrogenase family protein [Citricoccus sp. NR2]|uniref:aldehyde dehydrogenase family protein n=1 Tax=Citricoccus sp. NR2 TaxID=3004095 RepID=UPI0022DD9D76|nr:aldehyde dehydrogenase family protein [Citricoccus sp. NR2]WBL19754.1 aldehyde dehydrogenase family protein [Citricoccus sp. NR2]
MRTFNITDPASLELVDHAPWSSAEDLERAVQESQSISRVWAKNRDARREAMRAAAADLRLNVGTLGAILTREQGKPLLEAETEFMTAAELLNYYADLEWDESTELPERSGRSVSVQQLPVGLVGAITPWNFPISLLGVKVAPALAAGCTVISKPAATTPLSTLAYAQVLQRHLPKGVLQVLTDPGREMSVAISEHPAIRKISFTGSTEVGVAMIQQAAPTMKRATLELGGNDPAIILEDADLEATAQGIVASAFRNAGQVCMAVKRVYVPQARLDDCIEAFTAAVGRLTVGHGLDATTTLGPLHHQNQLNRVRELVDRAVVDGGTVAIGGASTCDLPGYFWDPTIVSVPDPETPLVSEEQFGAALPIVGYADLHELIESLNADAFGLGASVWGADEERASAIAQHIEAGTVWINQHTVVEVDAPFGGWGHSGVGRERGRWGLESYLELRTINRRRLSQR